MKLARDHSRPGARVICYICARGFTLETGAVDLDGPRFVALYCPAFVTASGFTVLPCKLYACAVCASRGEN
jgi:hypothetical protein